jgi:hypothetical protein
MGRGVNSNTLEVLNDETRNQKGNPGSTWRMTRTAVKKLEAMGFDPLEKLVEYYWDITGELAELKDKPRFSHTAYATLRASQRQTLEILMQYGYAKRRIDDKDPDTMEPLKIILERSK